MSFGAIAELPQAQFTLNSSIHAAVTAAVIR
jgi:hypothetical protein